MCGRSRLKLRKSFNHKEINVAKVIGKYDVDGDKVLEMDEFLEMLQDYSSWGKHVSVDEVNLVMTVADTDDDNCIDANEVMYALRVWYAYINMPRSAGRVISSISDGPLPSIESLTAAMQHLNEDYSVRPEEVAHVRSVALELGASEKQVAAKTMRMAISTWYLNIERGETPARDLAKSAVKDTHRRLFAANPLRRLCQGKCCDAATLAAAGFFLVMFVMYPLLEMYVADNFPTTEEEECHHSWLSNFLWFTGVLSMTWGVLFLFLTAVVECRANKICLAAAGTSLGVVTLVLVVVWIFSLWQTMESNPSHCGFVVWQFCNFTYLVVPIIMMIFSCCVLPGMYCAEYVHSRRVDQSLMDEEKPADGH